MGPSSRPAGPRRPPRERWDPRAEETRCAPRAPTYRRALAAHLLSAFDRPPGIGSEPEVGWRWATEIGRLGHPAVVLTWTRDRATPSRSWPTRRNWRQRAGQGACTRVRQYDWRRQIADVYDEIAAAVLEPLPGERRSDSRGTR